VKLVDAGSAYCTRTVMILKPLHHDIFKHWFTVQQLVFAIDEEMKTRG